MVKGLTRRGTSIETSLFLMKYQPFAILKEERTVQAIFDQSFGVTITMERIILTALDRDKRRLMVDERGSL